MATSDKSNLYSFNTFINFAFLGFLADGQQSTFKYFLNGSSLSLGELENIITVKPKSFSLSK